MKDSGDRLTPELVLKGGDQVPRPDEVEFRTHGSGVEGKVLQQVQQVVPGAPLTRVTHVTKDKVNLCSSHREG